MANFKSMRKTVQSKAICLVMGVLVILATSATCFATNGYMPISASVAGHGVVGAGIADVPNAMGGVANPGGLAFTGTQTDAGFGFFMPSRKVTITGAPSGALGSVPLAPGEHKSGNNFFVVPSYGKTWKKTDDTVIGFSFCGNGGMNTEYGNEIFAPGMNPTNTTPVGVNLAQMCFATSYAKKINEKHGLGIALLTPVQMFRAQGLQAFGGASSDPTALTNNGTEMSFGVGFRVGYMGEITDKLNIGISYMSDVKMSEFDDYAGLFAEQGDFDIPGGITVGIKYEIDDAFKFLFDYQKINYGGVNSISNPMMPNMMGSQLGDDDGAGFGWEDQDIYKFGLVWKKDEKLTYRIGYSCASQIIPTSETMFNILAPATIRKHAGFGVSKKLTEKKILHMAVSRAFGETVDGSNLTDPGQDIAIYMDQWKVSVGYTWLY